MMLKNIFILLAAIICSYSLSAQQPGQMGRRTALEQVEAEKIAFFTRYLDLSSQEAKEFWPVYDEFQSRRNRLIQERQILSGNFSRNYGNMNEEEAEEIADRYIKLQVQESELTKEYHEKFKNVLPAGKVMRLYEAENEFRSQLLRRIRRGGGGRR